MGCLHRLSTVHLQVPPVDVAGRLIRPDRLGTAGARGCCCPPRGEGGVGAGIGMMAGLSELRQMKMPRRVASRIERLERGRKNIRCRQTDYDVKEARGLTGVIGERRMPRRWGARGRLRGLGGAAGVLEPVSGPAFGIVGGACRAARSRADCGSGLSARRQRRTGWTARRGPGSAVFFCFFSLFWGHRRDADRRRRGSARYGRRRVGLGWWSRGPKRL